MSSTDSQEHQGFIHARPTLYLAGTVRPDLNDAIQSAEVNLPLHGRAHGEIRLINWSNADIAFPDIRLGDSVSLSIGESAVTSLFEGEITGMEERYGDGAPQLVLLVEDKLHRLVRRRNNRRFEAMSIDSVVRQVAGDAGLSADTDLDSSNATWLQMNESDLAFLMRLVAPFGIGLRLEGEQIRARFEEADPDPVYLSPDAGTAKSVRVVTDLNHQPSSVMVMGYDLSSDQAVRKEVGTLEPVPAGTTATSELSRLGWETASIIPHPFTRSQSEADSVAKGQFDLAASRFLHGEILCPGTAALRAGREIVLSGVSNRIAGRYRVSDCSHFFGSSGYETSITVQKADQS